MTFVKVFYSHYAQDLEAKVNDWIKKYSHENPTIKSVIPSSKDDMWAITVMYSTSEAHPLD